MSEYTKKLKKALIKKFGYAYSEISVTRGRGTACLTVYITITKPFGFMPTLSKMTDEHSKIVKASKKMDEVLNYFVRFVYPNGRMVRPG